MSESKVHPKKNVRRSSSEDHPDKCHLRGKCYAKPWLYSALQCFTIQKYAFLQILPPLTFKPSWGFTITPNIDGWILKLRSNLWINWCALLTHSPFGHSSHPNVWGHGLRSSCRWPCNPWSLQVPAKLKKMPWFPELQCLTKLEPSHVELLYWLILISLLINGL